MYIYIGICMILALLVRQFTCSATVVRPALSEVICVGEGNGYLRMYAYIRNEFIKDVFPLLPKSIAILTNVDST